MAYLQVFMVCDISQPKNLDGFVYIPLQAISKFPCASVSEQVRVWNHSYENDFDLHENDPVGRTL